ncbi:MAG: universal stress protein [Dehalococcoidales bacterium]|nr:universal stress protein [Dehalococcoidales bacterium]
MLEKILITIGLSTPVWTIFPYVQYLARYFSSELHLLGISTRPQQVWDNSLTGYINNWTAQLKENNIPFKTDFIHGNPAVETVKYVYKWGINLITTSIFKNNEITCTILTNIAQKMGIRASFPLLLIPPGSFKESNVLTRPTIKKILVPMDCPEAGEAVIPYIKAMAGRLNSSVTLLHVSRPPPRPVPVVQSEVVSISQAVGKEYLQKINRYLQSEGIAANSEVIDGLPAKTILKYAKQNKFDLIAMSTQYSAGVGDRLFGNTTSKVIEKADIPVLTMSYPALKGLSTEALEGVIL